MDTYRNFLQGGKIMAEYISSISNDALSILCEELQKNNHINPDYYNRFEIEAKKAEEAEEK